MGIQLKRQIILGARSFVKNAVDRASFFFNGLSVTRKRIMLLIFGVVMGGISFTLIMQALKSQENRKTLSFESISTPSDIYMRITNESQDSGSYHFCSDDITWPEAFVHFH